MAANRIKLLRTVSYCVSIFLPPLKQHHTVQKMVVLRSGKITKATVLVKRKKTNKLFAIYGIRECSVKLNRLNVGQKKSIDKKKTAAIPSKTIKTIGTNNKKTIEKLINLIWNELTTHSYVIGPSVIVLAKMPNYRPWPARINTMYI